MHFGPNSGKARQVWAILALGLLVGCAADMPEEAADVAEEAAPAAVETALTGDRIPTDQGDLVVHPIGHATFVMGLGDTTIYVDPVGEAGLFEGLPEPDVVLVSDVHGDHLNAETLAAVVADDSVIIAPAAVTEQLPEGLGGEVRTLANGDETSLPGISIEAIPMYNLTEDRLQFHEKGRGNGYVVTLGGRRVYISGDTEDIPEMRALENIDVAFVCFNLPYTMTEDQAASAVREFAPGIVYPYHFGESDVALFTELVGEDSGVEVRTLGWY